MTQLDDSTADPYKIFNALLEESNGDFFFELDSLLLGADGFNADVKVEATYWDCDPVAATEGVYAEIMCKRDDASLLRDDEVFWPSSALTNATRAPCSTSDLVSWSVGEPQRSVRSSRHKPRATPTPVSKKPEVPKKKNQNRSRKRQREEILDLRASVDELQTELEGLLTGGDGPNRISPKQMQMYLHESLVWKRAAAVDQQQAGQCAMENLKLRAIIQENELVCKNFSEACTKARVFRGSPIDSLFANTALKRPVTLPDSATFESLRLGLDMQYQQLSAVLGECDFTIVKTEVANVLANKLRTDGGGHLFFEHIKVHISPFTTKAVSQTLWRLTKNGLLTPSNGELKICRTIGNTLYGTLTDTILVPHSPDTLITAWLVVKRVIEDGQVVLMWRANLEIHHTPVIRLTECGWDVMRGIPGVNGAPGSFTSAPCFSQTCIRSYPDCPISKAEMVTGSVTEKILSQFHHNMNMLHQKIENVLLDESLASRCASVK